MPTTDLEQLHEDAIAAVENLTLDQLDFHVDCFSPRHLPPVDADFVARCRGCHLTGQAVCEEHRQFLLLLYETLPTTCPRCPIRGMFPDVVEFVPIGGVS